MLLRPALDLTRYAWSHQHGDITVFGTWWLAEDSGPRPCLALIPTARQSWQKAKACVVHVDDAWKWSEEIGDGAYACRASMVFADALGLDAGNPKNVFRVRSIVVDHLGDLLAIPPMPGSMRSDEVIGEARIIERESGKTIEHEVVERV